LAERGRGGRFKTGPSSPGRNRKNTKQKKKKSHAKNIQTQSQSERKPKGNNRPDTQEAARHRTRRTQHNTHLPGPHDSPTQTLRLPQSPRQNPKPTTASVASAPPSQAKPCRHHTAWRPPNLNEEPNPTSTHRNNTQNIHLTESTPSKPERTPPPTACTRTAATGRAPPLHARQRRKPHSTQP